MENDLAQQARVPINKQYRMDYQDLMRQQAGLADLERGGDAASSSHKKKKLMRAAKINNNNNKMSASYCHWELLQFMPRLAGQDGNSSIDCHFAGFYDNDSKVNDNLLSSRPS